MGVSGPLDLGLQLGAVPSEMLSPPGDPSGAHCPPLASLEGTLLASGNIRPCPPQGHGAEVSATKTPAGATRRPPGRERGGGLSGSPPACPTPTSCPVPWHCLQALKLCVSLCRAQRAGAGGPQLPGPLQLTQPRPETLPWAPPGAGPAPPPRPGPPSDGPYSPWGCYSEAGIGVGLCQGP